MPPKTPVEAPFRSKIGVSRSHFGIHIPPAYFFWYVLASDLEQIRARRYTDSWLSQTLCSRSNRELAKSKTACISYPREQCDDRTHENPDTTYACGTITLDPCTGGTQPPVNEVRANNVKQKVLLC